MFGITGMLAFIPGNAIALFDGYLTCDFQGSYPSLLKKRKKERNKERKHMDDTWPGHNEVASGYHESTWA